jgi:thiosulfate/3-mercaptopyruvate sulfurtransferase
MQAHATLEIAPKTASSYLVSTDWLQQHLQDPKVRIVEVDEDTSLYETGHIPMALSWNWTTQLNDLVRRDILGKSQFERLMSASGIAPDSTIILYGENHNWFAAFAAWVLALYGHKDVRLMDGGRKKWINEGRPLVHEKPATRATPYVAKAPNLALRATRDQLLAAMQSGVAALVDVRSADEYAGKILAPPGLKETALRGGHIPGAVNIPWSKAVREDGTIRPVGELRELYKAVLAAPSIVAYCRIGERSSHTWFVLHCVLGIDRVSNYDGSWTEYGNLVGAPITIGPNP